MHQFLTLFCRRFARGVAVGQAVMAAGLLSLGCGSVMAADYPDKPVRIVVSVQPGGATDTAARIVAKKLSERLGENFLVDNRPGGATRLGTELVMKSKPDGYTLGLFYGIAGLFHLMFENYPQLDPGKDFEMVTLFARAPSFLAVNSRLPVTSMPEFVAYAKQRDGKITFGHSGGASTANIASLALLKSVGVQGLGVAYKGNGPTAVAIAAGEIDFGLVDYASARPMVERGSVRLIAVTEPKRSALLPQLPTTTEHGLPSSIEGITPWFFLAAPSGTPPAIIATLNRHVSEVLKSSEVLSVLQSAGVDAEVSTPAHAAAYYLEQRKKLIEVTREHNVSLRN